MKKTVIIEDVRGGITTGWTYEEIKNGDMVQIIAQDENGNEFKATGKVIEFEEI